MEIQQPGGSGSGSPLTVTDGTTTVNNVTNITFTSGAVVTNGGGGIVDVAVSGSGSPGGSNTQVQYNNAGNFGGSSGITLSATKVTSMAIALGSDATGDIYYNGGSGVLTRLGIGSSGQVLTVAAGIPSWAATAASTLIVGSTTISSGTTTRILYDNAGVLGEYTLTGTGTVVVMATSPTIVTPTIAKIANLTTNGYVKTSGSDGTLGVQTVPIPVADGGTGTTTQFTQGSVIFAGASGVYTQDNANFFWDATNHRLGIGTTSPAVPLHVVKTTEALRLGYDGSNYSSFTMSSSGRLTIGLTGSSSTIAIGNTAGASQTSTQGVFIGTNAGANATTTDESIFIGDNAGLTALQAKNAIFIGPHSGDTDGVDNSSTGTSIAIGRYSGTGGFKDSIALGHGVVNSATNQINIGNVFFATGLYASDTQSSTPITTGSYTLPGFTSAGFVKTSSAGLLSVDTGTYLTTLTVGTTTITSGTTTRILYDNAGVLGEYTISGSGTVVAMATGATLTSPTITTKISPTSNDGAPLGDTTHQFSDLFLAEGGVINWDNGDATMTQTGDDITFAGISTFSVGTGTAVTLGTIELGAASDTTLARVSAGVVSIEGVTIDTASNTLTLTNKRITPRVVTASDATSVTPNTDNADITYQANTQSTGTLTMNADSGTPTNGQKWTFKIKSTNVQTFSWNSVYVAGTGPYAIPLPTASTGSSKIDYVGFTYDTVNSKWHCTSIATGY